MTRVQRLYLRLAMFGIALVKVMDFPNRRAVIPASP